MMVTTLGTSHGNHTYCRFNSSTLIEVGERCYLIDAGEPVAGLLVRAGKDVRKIAAVFVTHQHGDHVSGLPKLMLAIRKQGRDRQEACRIFLPEESAEEALVRWLQAMHGEWPVSSLSLDTFHEGPVFDDGTVRLTALGTRHLAPRDGRPVSFAFLFEAERKRVLFTGDLSADFADFPSSTVQDGCDACICEITHFQPETALPVLRQLAMGRLILNHVHDPWHGEGEFRLQKLFASLPFPVDIAHDGDVFEL